MNSTRLRSGFVWLLILLAIAAILFSINHTPARQNKTFKAVVDDIRAGQVQKITIDGNDLTVEYRPGTSDKDVSSTKPGEDSLEQSLRNYDVPIDKWPVIDYKRPSDWSGIFQFLAYTLPAILVVGIIYFMLRQAQGTNNQALSFGKSRARMFTGDQPTVTFDDVAGVDEAKEELREVVEFLKEPEKFISLGARIPKGVLLVGSPGTGKTLLAKAVSGEAGVPFFSISGSEFVEMFVGVGASRVRDLFDQAKRHSPCIVFVDEIDAVGRHRGAGLGGSHDEREQTLNQILVEMDGFDTDTNVIVVAATNRPDILDPALLRPGRFDRRVVLDRPDVKGREQILKVHVRGKPLSPEVDLGTLAKATPGFVGADLENMINEGAILAARRNKKSISMQELEEAIERVVMGPERKSRIMTEREKRVTAYHEAGHAIVGHVLPRCNPVHKVSIVARGMAGGYTWSLPEEDNRLGSKAEFQDELAALLGGRAAEELEFNDVTTGASSDLERATELARAMVTRYGMSDKLGPMVFGQKEELVFLGKELGEQRDYSDAVALEIDTEVRGMIHEAYRRAKNILLEYRDRMDAVAKRLTEVETIDRTEFEGLMGGRKPAKVPQPPTPVLQPQPAAA